MPFLPHPVFLSIMAESPRRPAPQAQAEERIREILRAADSWAREAPKALMPAIRAVCIRLAEMVADQRHYLAPLPEPQESERRTVLTMVADKLRSREVTAGVEEHLKGLEELELRLAWSEVEGLAQGIPSTGAKTGGRCLGTPFDSAESDSLP